MTETIQKMAGPNRRDGRTSQKMAEPTDEMPMPVRSNSNSAIQDTARPTGME